MRCAIEERNTKETQIKLILNLDGGNISIDTGVGFFDHMLNSFATHGGFGLEISVIHTNTRSGKIIGEIVGNNYSEIIMCDG